MKVVYIAGPFRGTTPWVVERNVRAAEQVAFDCWARGVAALCPHANTRFFDRALPDEVWLEGDLEMLRRCDAIVLTEGYAQSRGAVAELAEARKIGLTVFYAPEGYPALEAWAKEP